MKMRGGLKVKTASIIEYRGISRQPSRSFQSIVSAGTSKNFFLFLVCPLFPPPDFDASLADVDGDIGIRQKLIYNMTMIKNKIFYIIIIIGISIIRIHSADTKEIQKPGNKNENVTDTTSQAKMIPGNEGIQQKCVDLDLGKMLEQAGRFEDANKAYLEALKCKDPEIRLQAIQAIRRLDSFHVQFNTRIRNFIRTIVELLTNPVLLIVIGCLIIIPIIRCIIKKIGTKKSLKIEVNPLKISPSSNTYIHFRAYMELIISRMNHYYDLRKKILKNELRSAKPTIRSETLSKFFEETANVIAPKFGRFLFKLYKLINPPEYVIDGFVDMTDANRYNNIISLKRRGKPKRMWEVNLPPSRISEGLKDLAFDVLIFLDSEGKEINNAYDHIK